MSTMTQDEIQHIYHHMEKKITENKEQMEKKIIINKEEMKINMEQMENNMDKRMDENKEEIQKSMKELQTSSYFVIFHASDERLPKGDIKMKGTHENKGSTHVVQPIDNKQFSS
jgi:hypothetical protein